MGRLMISGFIPHPTALIHEKDKADGQMPRQARYRVSLLYSVHVLIVMREVEE
jgi:hypothetical protein